MSSIDKLAEKAKEYVYEYDSVLNDFIEYRIATGKPDLLEKYNKQKLILDSLKFRSKILFSDSNKGEIFLKELESIEENPNNGKIIACQHKRVLEDFIYFRERL